MAKASPPEPTVVGKLEQQIADQKHQLHKMILRGTPTQRLEDALAAMYRKLQQLKMCEKP